MAIGYDQFELGPIRSAGAQLEGEDAPEFAPISAMTFAQALPLLHMHKHQVHGLGKRLGLPARARTGAG